jgi:hypothetical protein
MLGRLRRRAMLGIAIGLTAAALVVPTMIAPPAYAESGSQSDPADDFGRGGAEVNGQPACYMPAPDQTRRTMYSVNRPACFTGKLQ